MIPAFAAQLSGHLDTVTADSITGWAWNAEVPEECVSVEITISSGEGPGANTFTTTQALLPREDLKVALGSANHGFTLPVDWTKLHGETFTVTAAAISGTEKTPLIGTYSISKDALLDAKTSADSAGAVTLIPEAVQKAAEQANEVAAAATEEIPADKIALGPGYAGNKEAAVSPSTSKKTSTDKQKAEPTVPKKAAESGEYLGEFKATGYCNCQRCSGGYTKTYSGTIPKANHTLSADLNVFPIGTKLIIDGITYTVEDKGSSVNGKKVDIFFATHAEALAFGTQTVDVYAAK
jgi:3D (Asp-Asp-Asp) domain-containing protein